MASPSKLLSTGPLLPLVHELLAPFGELVITDGKRDSLMPHLPETIALIVRGDAKIDASLIDAMPHVRAIARTGVGYDNVDISAAKHRNIPVIYTPGVTARPVAEAALACMLTLVKQISFWSERMKAGDWASRFAYPVGDLDGSTLGIVGFGAIGRTVAQLAQPFSMRILAFDPYAQPVPSVELTSLDTLLRESDIVSLHAPLTPETRGVINAENIRKMKLGSHLINLGRGGLIDSLDTVLDALNSGHLAGAALDVFDPEPPDFTHAIFQHPRCLTSPHSLGGSKKATERIHRSMAEDLATLLRGGQPRHVVQT